jgi:hypothetical protein
VSQIFSEGNQVENSHQPTRRRERRMPRFKSAGHAERFFATYGPITSHFRPRHHLLLAVGSQTEDNAIQLPRDDGARQDDDQCLPPP